MGRYSKARRIAGAVDEDWFSFVCHSDELCWWHDPYMRRYPIRLREYPPGRGSYYISQIQQMLFPSPEE
jgi:hypothetical protein